MQIKNAYELTKIKDPTLLFELAQNPDTKTDILEELAQYPDLVIRHAVANNPKTSKEVLKRLSFDREVLIRDYAKRNLNKKEQNNES